MNVSSPTNFSNMIVPVSAPGRQAVGEENIESKTTPFKSIERSADSAHLENRRSPEGQTAELEQRIDLNEDEAGEKPAQQDSAEGERSEQGQEQQEQSKKEQEKQQQINDQARIAELAARDREVRAHEAAHAAVGGQFAGSPQFSFTRGPDGVSYAVGGEVSISTGAVANDPQATIAKARQIKSAALAPADPSPQDRNVAAAASQMAMQAQAELSELQTSEARQRAERSEINAEVRSQQAEEKEQRRLEAEAQESQERAASFERQSRQSEFSRKSIDINSRLVEIGVTRSASSVGSLFDQSI